MLSSSPGPFDTDPFTSFTFRLSSNPDACVDVRSCSSSTQQLRSVAALGFDFVWLDPEHSSMNVETLTELIHTVSFASEGRTVPVVRVPGHGHEWIASSLDAGAGGIMIPQIDTGELSARSSFYIPIADSCLVAEQAREVCASVTFGAKNGGTRSVPPFRLIRGVTDVVPEGKTIIDVWNEYPAIIAQIEYVLSTHLITDTSNTQSDVCPCRSMKGVENIEEICQVERIDCIFVRPFFLSLGRCHANITITIHVDRPSRSSYQHGPPNATWRGRRARVRRHRQEGERYGDEVWQGYRRFCLPTPGEGTGRGETFHLDCWVCGRFL